VIEIREPNYSVDLPGDWEAEPGEEVGSANFHQLDGAGKLSVMLLGVKPMFAIADQQRLLEDYMKHRSNFEVGQAGALELSDPELERVLDSYVGSWIGFDREHDRRLQHHVVLLKGLLVDFCYESTGVDESEFEDAAQTVLETAAVTVD
jgi:hypothetical protein